MADEKKTVLLKGARLIFKNLKGASGPYNREGDRNFGVIIPDPAIAEQMLADGWNIKYLKPSQEEEEAGLEKGPPWLQVKAGYGKGKPPKIVMISSQGETVLTDETVETLDIADITNVDILINPYHYDVQGSQGISAYVKTMMVTIEEDELELEYAARRNEGQTPG